MLHIPNMIIMLLSSKEYKILSSALYHRIRTYGWQTREIIKHSRWTEGSHYLPGFSHFWAREGGADKYTGKWVCDCDNALRKQRKWIFGEKPLVKPAVNDDRRTSIKHWRKETVQKQDVNVIFFFNIWTPTLWITARG